MEGLLFVFTSGLYSSNAAQLSEVNRIKFPLYEVCPLRVSDAKEEVELSFFFYRETHHLKRFEYHDDCSQNLYSGKSVSNNFPFK